MYGNTVRPTDAMLQGLDALVFDVQDAGVRLHIHYDHGLHDGQAAAAHHLAYFVLDRPDPLGPASPSKAYAWPRSHEFHRLLSHARSNGDDAGRNGAMFNDENKIGCDLRVIAMRNYRRDWFQDTGLLWVNPRRIFERSRPILYPALEILQAGVSVGRELTGRSNSWARRGFEPANLLRI